MPTPLQKNYIKQIENWRKENLKVLVDTRKRFERLMNNIKKEIERQEKTKVKAQKKCEEEMQKILKNIFKGDRVTRIIKTLNQENIKKVNVDLNAKLKELLQECIKNRLNKDEIDPKINNIVVQLLRPFLNVRRVELTINGYSFISGDSQKRKRARSPSRRSKKSVVQDKSVEEILNYPDYIFEIKKQNENSPETQGPTKTETNFLFKVDNETLNTKYLPEDLDQNPAIFQGTGTQWFDYKNYISNPCKEQAKKVVEDINDYYGVKKNNFNK